MTIRLNGQTSGYVELEAPATAGSNTLTLPTNNGTSGQYLQTNGSGALSWQTVASLSNAQDGTGTDFQFNSGYGSVATAYGCRAWIQFHGGTMTIAADGNVDTLTDNGLGDYTINFTTDMPDANYCAIVSNSNQTYVSDGLMGIKSVAAGSVRVYSSYIFGTNRGSYDQNPVMVAVFR